MFNTGDLLFWSYNIFYGVLAANVATGQGPLYLMLMGFWGIFCIWIANDILGYSNEIDFTSLGTDHT